MKYYIGIICLIIFCAAFALTEEEKNLLVAARIGNVSRVNDLIEDHVDVNVQDELEHEIEWKDIRATTAIGMPPEGQDRNWTPSMYACDGGHREVLEVLIAARADLNAQGRKFGETALIIASRGGYVNTIRLLLRNGADKTLADESGKVALDYAREMERNDIVKLLKKSR